MNEPRNIDPEPPPPVSISTPHIQKASHGTSRVLFFHDESSNPGKQFNPRHPIDFGRGLTEYPCPKGWKLPLFLPNFLFNCRHNFFRLENAASTPTFSQQQLRPKPYPAPPTLRYGRLPTNCSAHRRCHRYARLLAT